VESQGGTKVRWTIAVFVSVALAAAIVGCSSTPSATPTLAPGATATPGGATQPPGTTPTPGATQPPGGGTGTECAAYPTFSLSSPGLPGFEPDTTLQAKFPTEIDGQPVSDLETGYWAAFLCIGGQASYDQTVAGLGGGLNWASMSYGSATYTVDDEDTQLHAFRTPGQDANAIVQALAQLAAASGQEQDGTVSTGTVAGRAVLILTDSSGEQSYGFLSGDTLFFTDTVTDSQAAKIVAALP
jgi:hypothetical protein